MQTVVRQVYNHLTWVTEFIQMVRHPFYPPGMTMYVLNQMTKNRMRWTCWYKWKSMEWVSMKALLPPAKE